MRAGLLLRGDDLDELAELAAHVSPERDDMKRAATNAKSVRRPAAEGAFDGPVRRNVGDPEQYGVDRADEGTTPAATKARRARDPCPVSATATFRCSSLSDVEVRNPRSSEPVATTSAPDAELAEAELPG